MLLLCDEVEDYITEFERENEGEYKVVSTKYSKKNEQSQETTSINIYEEKIEDKKETNGKCERGTTRKPENKWGPYCMPVNDQDDQDNGNDHEIIFSMVNEKKQNYSEEDSSSIDSESTITMNLPTKPRKTSKITIFADNKIVATKTIIVDTDKSDNKTQNEKASLKYTYRQQRTTMATICDMCDKCVIQSTVTSRYHDYECEKKKMVQLGIFSDQNSIENENNAKINDLHMETNADKFFERNISIIDGETKKM